MVTESTEKRAEGTELIEFEWGKPGTGKRRENLEIRNAGNGRVGFGTPSALRFDPRVRCLGMWEAGREEEAGLDLEIRESGTNRPTLWTRRGDRKSVV